MSMMLRTLFVVMVLLLVGSETLSSAFRVERADVTVRQSNILGVDMEYATIDVTFDRDLYLQTAVTCPNDACAEHQLLGPIDCSCDYTDPNNCGHPVSNDPSCPKCTNFTRAYYSTDVCSQHTPWQVIHANQTYHYTNQSFTEEMTMSGWVEFRYKANNTYCEAISVIVSTEIGDDLTLFLNNDGSNFGRKIGQDSVNARQQLTVCPSDNSQMWAYIWDWTVDTYFIWIRPSRDIVPIFSLTLLSVPVYPPPAVPVACAAVTPNHTCIVDGEVVNGTMDGGMPQYYTFEVTHNMSLSFACPTLMEDIDVFISEDPTSAFPNRTHYTWAFYQVFDDYGTLVVAPHSNGTARILYITIVSELATGFICTFSSKAPIWKDALVDQYAKGGTFNLQGTARVQHPDGEYYHRVFYDDNGPFTILFPRQDNNPLWPVPTIFSQIDLSLGLQYQSTITIRDATNSPKPRSFQAAFILSYRKEDLSIVLSNLTEILNSKIDFLNIIVDADGNALDLRGVPLTLAQQSCNYTAFESIVDKIKAIGSVMYNTTSFNELMSNRYQADIYTMSNDWVGCTAQANSLLATETVTTTVATKACPYSDDSVEFNNDPCCHSPGKTFFQCCVPRNVTVVTNAVVGVRNDLISKQCSSTGCTASVLSDYQRSLGDIDHGGCPLTTSQDYQKFLEATANTLRYCQAQVLRVVYCSDDNDCASVVGGSCNMYTRRCEAPAAVQDQEYVRCVINSSSSEVQMSIRLLIGLEGNSTIDELVDGMVYVSSNVEDCVSYTGIQYRIKYTYTSKDQSHGINNYYPVVPLCYDTKSCVVQHDTGLDGSIGGFYYQPISMNSSTCSQQMNCRHCPLGDTACLATCSASPKEFCGHCTNNLTRCHVFSQYTNVTECNASNQVCLLPNGKYVPDLSPSDCQKRGACSHDCGRQCAGPFIGCAARGSIIFNETLCTDNVTYGVWSDPLNLCSNNFTQEECAQNSMTMHWVNCAQLSADECHTVVEGLCRVTPIPCTTQEECERAGLCSDQQFFQPNMVRQYPRGLGKCVRGHTLKSVYSVGPSCQLDEHDSPKGCYSLAPLVYTESECRALGSEYTWWTQSNNQTQCESHFGCQIPDDSLFAPAAQSRFNEMSESMCKGECSSDGQHTWTNMFSWTPAKWLPGVMVNASWLPGGAVSTSTFGYAVNYQAVADIVLASNQYHVADVLRSSTMCRMERLLENLESITCSCAGHGGAECFKSSALALGSTKPCVNARSTYEFAYGLLKFSEKSVPASCVTVIVSQISRQLFKATPKVSLSSNFVSYPKPEAYGIPNDHGAIIGIVLGDGIKVQSLGVNSYMVCLSMAGSSFSDKFPTLDFAHVREDAANKSMLVPMEVPTIISTDNNLLCASLNQPATDTTYFPIARVSHGWATQAKKPFDKTTTNMLYTLGAVFVFCAGWGMLQLMFVVHRRIFRTELFELVHGLILSCVIFTAIRAAYFFILPSGMLYDSTIADYILVVLPTFIYFTSFTIIVVLWYVVVNMKFNVSLTTKFNSLIVATNAVLYLIFIIIVLVFNYTKSNLVNMCGARLFMDVTTTTPQRIVSILYAAIQAVISLLLGAAFIYLGSSIVRAIRQAQDTMEQQKKVFIVTASCSVGFILHCIFVLILVAADPANIYFSFVGLIITEIVPVLTILFSYNQLSKYRNGIQRSRSSTTLGSKMKDVTPNVSGSQSYSSSSESGTGGLTSSSSITFSSSLDTSNNHSSNLY
ncbi:hypothetical protein SAMD00019534_044350 [Acytostelium subglobosum LB1]|uniref:hypothetical protein n=1 Tax=Acytostelium subglobosum LB1 TaxID=1410327 RepID=UPI000644BC90|nr:hypothetical protein SAMD00019534_044350 [Acytostelium subglobosum LB1]GAM21260.1 hypothetical protein SAMD00019534_044350 [Acytostelium subglobosum LB1]|eukprot:XP_012755379.1 hypothetical protein SAMD00019534_044350 [Acytostelium subglobosum LB1]